MNADDRRAALAEVRQANNCSHPIRIAGEMVNVTTGEVFRRGLTVACKDRRRAICPACSYLYKADAYIMAAAGLIGGKGIDESVLLHPRLFVTLTAPSFGVVHRITHGQQCHPHPRVAHCVHGHSLVCRLQHHPGDAVLGSPICPHCFDYEGAVRWNAHANRLWNELVTRLRRELGASQGLVRREVPHHFTLNYFKVAEFQLRGLVHFHVVLRVDGPGDPNNAPPLWATADLLTQVITHSVRLERLILETGDILTWGRQLHIAQVHEGLDAKRVAGYLAKYAVKTTDGSLELARRFTSRQQVDDLRNPHQRRLALTAWDLGFTRHAHAFGYPGNLITKSRSYSTTFREMREERAAYMAPSNDLAVIPGTFLYDGRGYLHPKAQALAELFFAMDVELRKEAAQRKVSSEMNPSEEQSTAQTETPGRFNPQQIREK